MSEFFVEQKIMCACCKGKGCRHCDEGYITQRIPLRVALDAINKENGLQK